MQQQQHEAEYDGATGGLNVQLRGQKEKMHHTVQSLFFFAFAALTLLKFRLQFWE